MSKHTQTDRFRDDGHAAVPSGEKRHLSLPGAASPTGVTATEPPSPASPPPGSSLPRSTAVGAVPAVDRPSRGGAAEAAPRKGTGGGGDGRYDVVVVGARCAGASTAMLLARSGLRVLAVDRGEYGADTVSTHALMRGGVLQLRRWGLLDRLAAAGTPPARTTAFHYGAESIEIEIKPRDGVDALYSPRRTVLDALLVDAAREAGAEVRHGVRFEDVIVDDGGRVRGIELLRPDGGRESIAADLVVGADGVRSPVARRVGAGRRHAASHAAGVVYGYWSGLDRSGNHWYYRPGVSIGAIPTNDGDTCIFASVPGERFAMEIRRDLSAGYRRILGECDPELAAAVDGAERRGNLFGFPGIPGYLRRCAGPGWALVGDAGYFKDPITAHGITDALRDAELLARAAAEGTDAALERYQEVRDELSLDLLRLTDRIASFDWDLESLKPIHLELSRSMNREVEALLGLDAPAEDGVRLSA